MPSKRKFVPFTPETQAVDRRPNWACNRLKTEMRDCLDHQIDGLTNGAQKRMRYAVPWYASDIVNKGGYRLLGWPADIPFTDFSSIRGGVKTLSEIRRRWYLPDGDPDKLRFERASPEDRASAARDPESVHPTPQHLPELKARAAARAERDIVVESDAYHPENMQFVGRESTTTAPDPKTWRQQRRDTGQRRPRASDMSTRVRKRRERKGIKSMPFVLPGTDRVASGGGDERASKRRRLEEYPLEDAIIEFDLAVAFGGMCPDPEPMAGSERKTA